jgi:hypothetical protein
MLLAGMLERSQRTSSIQLAWVVVGVKKIRETLWAAQSMGDV